MKKRFTFVRGMAFFSFIIILFLGLNFFYTPFGSSAKKSDVIHTYLVKIPNDAGVCPYALVSRTNGKLKIVGDSHCVCPYAESAFYMTTRCKDVKTVMEMLPSSLHNKVQIKIIDHINKTPVKRLSKSFASAAL